MTIVASNSLTLSNVNDGTITHVAYANKSKDIFYDSLPSFANLSGYQEALVSSVPEDGAYKITTTGGTHVMKTFVSINGTSGKALWSIVRLKNTHPTNNLRLVFNGIGDGTVLNNTFPTVLIKPGEDYFFMKSGIARNNYDFIQITFQSDSEDKDLAFNIYEASFYNSYPFVNFSFVPNNHHYLGNYTDALASASTDITKYNWGLIRGNASYTHTAYSWSSDGTDGFTTVYPNLNLLTDSTFKNYTPKIQQYLSMVIKNGGVNNEPYVSISYNNPTANSWTDTISWGFDKEYFKPSTTYTFSFYLRGNGTIRTHVYPSLIDTSTYNGLADGKVIRPASDGNYDWSLTSEWVRHTYTFITKSSITANENFLFRLYTGNSVDICLPKVEEGSIATPWMPSKSEVKTSDYPSYIGTYSDSNVESSLDYNKYQWTIFKGQNSNAYTAYAWSSDGTDRFSTVYPNLNLLQGSSAKTKDGLFKNFDKVENDYGEVTIKGTNTWVSKNLWDGFSIQPRDYKPNDNYTMSMDVMFTSWNLPAGTTITEFWIGQRYSAGGGISSYKQICAIDLPRDPSQMLNQWIRITKTSTIPPYVDPAVNTEALFMTKFTGPSEGSFTVRVRKPKQEFGSIATPWMPSQSEAQEQWQDAIPMYVGVGEKDSQNPTDYRWQLNPRYVQASSDSGLSNKAGLDDLASVADTANDALVQAQNAVSNEDYTSWLEHDYQTTINNLQDVSAQNQEDINNVDDRTTIVEGFYGEMKVKWNFIDESFTFSEEGMFISNAQSKMAIQVTSDKIVFWDNNVDVAFITGEVLNIQKGVFLESATIGNHLITKFSDESPVTIIRYVGGIT
ncbi:tail protein [Lactococcus phage WRP3]|uniref:Tail protein n=2 Tax=Audreyjarvisvirus TaxID=2843351 RepID=A0A0D3MTD5_9CAUD|nr:host range and adsorption protein [Lactococcus phage WRP3]AIX12653.1 tail protein [Lactococcus phage WRP3]